jgi:flavin reductase (DIM6/NTAB) family NADH-FMN oxidoreductase RutF
MLAERSHDAMKIDVEYLEFLWPMRHFLITCGDAREECNIIAVSFCMPVSRRPPLIACAIGKRAHSNGLIEATGEFVVNVPAARMEHHVYYCGTHSGSNVDKFRETGLTSLAARAVKVPVIGECVAHMECRVVKRVETGDKNLFIGEVTEAYADEEYVKTGKEVDFAMGVFPRKIYGTRFG